jgi:hypothetical protein
VHPSADFDRDAAARVLRRALELAERDLSSVPADLVSEQALVEAADELGVDPLAVRRAAAEERLGVLASTSHPLDRLVGPPGVSATRVVERPAPEVIGLVDTWLRRNGTLRRRTLDEHALVATYTRRSDLIAGVQRTARSVRGEEHLGRVRRLQLVVRPVDDGRSVVALVADLELERTAAVAGGSSVAGAGSAVAMVEALGGAPWLWLGVPASVAAGVGVLRWRAHGVPDVEAALQGVLDRAVASELPNGMLSDVRERLLAGWSRPRRTA